MPRGGNRKGAKQRKPTALQKALAKTPQQEEEKVQQPEEEEEHSPTGELDMLLQHRTMCGWICCFVLLMNPRPLIPSQTRLSLDWPLTRFGFFGPASCCTSSFCVFGPVLSSPAHAAASLDMPLRRIEVV
jgi:hypothetical protein